jgi:hypothetical protein
MRPPAVGCGSDTRAAVEPADQGRLSESESRAASISIALLLANLDGEAHERGEIILAPPYAGDWLATGALIGALQETVKYFALELGELSREDLRSELKILAEGFAL